MHLNAALLNVQLRAERGEPSVLVKLLLDLRRLLSSDDHQVRYGRRGSGKTHALKVADGAARAGTARRCFIGLALAACAAGVPAAATAATPTEIDVGVRQLRTCALRVLAFRTALDGLAVDACGRIYRSADGGRGWRQAHDLEARLYGAPKSGGALAGEEIELVHWWSATDGMAGFVNGFAFVTSDGGHTWERVAVPEVSLPTALSIAGDSLWLCDADGRVLRAEGRGRRWSAMASPFAPLDVYVAGPGEPLEPPPTRECAALEFEADGHGYGIAENGSRWATRDGGATWRAVRPVALRERAGTRCSAHAGDRTLRCEGLSVVVERSGAPERRAPLVTPPTGEQRPLLGVERTTAGWIGWTREHLVRSEDGETWFVEKDLPAAPRRITELPSGSVVLEAEDGRVFRGAGETWVPSPAPALDAADVAQHRLGVVAEAPFTCLGDSDPAWLEVSWSTHGCFLEGVAERVLRVEIEGGTGRARFENLGEVRERRLDPGALRALVRSLAGAVEPLERTGACFASTSRREVTIRWECKAGGAGSLSFTRFMCASRTPLPTRRSEADGRSRALEVERVVRQEYDAARETGGPRR